jgi:hypothetical protein
LHWHSPLTENIVRIKDGIYYANFYTPNKSDSGEGIAVFRDGYLNGGDHGYTYQGRFIRNEYEASLEATIERWKPDVESVFGHLKSYKIKFKGENNSKFEKTTLIAELSDDPSNTITVELTYLKPLNG